MKHPEIIALASVWAIILLYIAYIFAKICRDKEYRRKLDKKAKEKKKKGKEPSLWDRIKWAVTEPVGTTDMYGNPIESNVRIWKETHDGLGF